MEQTGSIALCSREINIVQETSSVNESQVVEQIRAREIRRVKKGIIVHFLRRARAAIYSRWGCAADIIKPQATSHRYPPEAEMRARAVPQVPPTLFAMK